MLNDEQITFYRQNGYVAVEDVLSRDEVDDLRRVTDEFIERSRLLIKGGEIFDLGPDHTGDRPQVRRINAPWKHHSVYDRTLRHEGILDIVDQLIGPGLRIRGGKLNMKSEDRISQVEWHQDWAFFPHTNDDLLTVGVAIDDMDVSNGCLQVIPGSASGPALRPPSGRVFRWRGRGTGFRRFNRGSGGGEGGRSLDSPRTNAPRLPSKRLRSAAASPAFHTRCARCLAFDGWGLGVVRGDRPPRRAHE